jgi:hypothetical protein
MRTPSTLLAVFALVGANSAVAQDLNPVGEYTFETAVQSEPVTGTITISGTAGAWEGTLSATALPEALRLTSVTVRGATVTLTALVPEQGEVLIELVFDGEEFTGTWTLGYDGGDMRGRKKPAF